MMTFMAGGEWEKGFFQGGRKAPGDPPGVTWLPNTRVGHRCL